MKETLSDTLVVTLNNTSAQQRVPLLDTSAKQRMTVFAGNQNILPFDWAEFLDTIAFSIRIPRARYSEAYQTMLASESILRRDWEQPEEDAAWADL